MEMMLKRFFQIGAVLFLGGLGVLAIIGMVSFMMQAEPRKVDGYGVAPVAEMARIDLPS